MAESTADSFLPASYIAQHDDGLKSVDMAASA